MVIVMVNKTQVNMLPVILGFRRMLLSVSFIIQFPIIGLVTIAVYKIGKEVPSEL